jgi:small membrane protein
MDVMLSQWVLMGALILVGVYLLKAKRSASQQAIRRLVILAALFLGALAVLFPNYTSVVACYLGIGRGTDLLLYAFVVFALFYVVHQYRRQLWQEKTITDLARALTLVRAAQEDHAPKNKTKP